MNRFTVVFGFLAMMSGAAATARADESLLYWSSSDTCEGSPSGIILVGAGGECKRLTISRSPNPIWSVKIAGVCVDLPRDPSTAAEFCTEYLFD